MGRKTLPVTTMIMAILLSTAAPLAATAAELDGVQLGNTLAVGHTTLRLNGIGLRTKYFFKIYVAGLYVTQPEHRAAAIIQSRAPKVLVMQFLRDFSRSQMVEAYREAFAKNGSPPTAGQEQDIKRFLAFLPNVHKGERFTFTYEPGAGSTFRVGSFRALTLPGKAFSDRFLQVFIGPHPPTAELKRGLLGTNGS